MVAPVMSATNRTLFGPNVRTPADRSGPETPPSCATGALDTAERPPGRASPTADAAANRKTSRLEWPLVVGFSLMLFLLEVRECIFPPPNNLDLDFTPIGVALELPDSSRPKTGGSAEGVLHKLHVHHLLTLHPAEDGEWRCHGLAHFG